MARHNLVRVSTATTGQGTMTLGSAVPGFLSFAQGGAQDGETLVYGIQDGAHSEVGVGVYSAAGPTLTRAVVLASTNGGAKIELSGTAQVYVTQSAEEATRFAQASDGLLASRNGAL